MDLYINPVKLVCPEGPCIRVYYGGYSAFDCFHEHHRSWAYCSMAECWKELMFSAMMGIWQGEEITIPLLIIDPTKTDWKRVVAAMPRHFQIKNAKPEKRCFFMVEDASTAVLPTTIKTESEATSLSDNTESRLDKLATYNAIIDDRARVQPPIRKPVKPDWEIGDQPVGESTHLRTTNLLSGDFDLDDVVDHRLSDSKVAYAFRFRAPVESNLVRIKDLTTYNSPWSDSRNWVGMYQSTFQGVTPRPPIYYIYEDRCLDNKWTFTVCLSLALIPGLGNTVIFGSATSKKRAILICAYNACRHLFARGMMYTKPRMSLADLLLDTPLHYESTRAGGPSHKPIFVATVTSEAAKMTVNASGYSKADSEERAAARMLEKLCEENMLSESVANSIRRYVIKRFVSDD